MSNWKNLFTEAILDRGLEYFNDDLVTKLKKKNNDFSATVIGAENYKVDLTIENREVTYAHCTCPHFAEGNNCKHLAATLFEIEEVYGDKILNSNEEEEIEKKKNFVTLPFNNDGKPHYLNFGNSLNIYKPTASTYKKALEILEEHKPRAAEIRISDAVDSRYIVYSIRIDLDSSHEMNDVTIKLGHDGIRIILCENASWYHNKTYTSLCKEFTPRKDGIIELCIHKTLALISLIRFIEKNRDFIDYSDATAVNLISGFKKEKKIATAPIDESNAREVDIEPHISIKDKFEIYRLSFKVLAENGKYYKIKDLSRLYEAYKIKDKYVLNANCMVDFKSATLTERATKCLQFIKTALFNYRMGYADVFRYGSKDEIELKPMFDEFFDIFKGSTIFYNDQPITGYKEVDPEFSMQIEEERVNDEIVGIKVKGRISGKYNTNKYTYWFEGGSLKRADRTKLGSASSLAFAANPDGEFSFTVGMSLIDNFYQRVLPELRRYGKIEDNAIDKIEDKLDEAPVAVFYLDIEKNKLTCSVKLRYKESEESVTPYDNHRYGSYIADKFQDYKKDIIDNLNEIFYRSYDSHKWYVDNNDTDMFMFYTYGIPSLMELGEVNATDAVKNIVVRKMPDISSHVDIDENDDSILNFELDTQGLTIEELVAILKSYEDKKKFHRLTDGSFINLENTNLNSLRELFSSMNISIKDFVDGKMHLPLYRALYLEQILQEKNGLTGEGGAKYRKLVKEFKTISESDFNVPESLNNTMRSYQKDGYRWMRVLFEHGFGGILADDMGLGKTLQTLSMLQALKDEGKDVHALIVTPASLVFNWKAEVNKFTPSLKVATVSGSTKERKDIINKQNDYDILITSYDLLKRDIALYESITFNIEIIDEAQFIKNHNTASAKSVRAIKSKHRLALTGTPIENRLTELWSIFEYLMPGFMFNQEQFKKFIANPIEKYKDQDAAKTLKRLTGPFILRRIKSDVLKDLPEKIEEIRVTPLSGEQEKLYIAEVAKTQGMLKKSEDIKDKKIEILAELMKIREICCDPSLVFKDYKGESAKREATMDLIKSAIDGGHKILLFSQFTSMLSLLEEDLKKEEIEYYTITGETGKAKRLELVESFNNGTVPLFLISLKAGGTGLNLTAADIVIHYDPWWNIAVQNQATDRAHRIGQTKRVTVYKMIAENTIEERIVKMQENKKDLANAIISTENVSLSSLTKEDLMELLSLSTLS